MSRDTEVRFTPRIYVMYRRWESCRIPARAATNSLMRQSSSVSSSKLATVTLAQIVASRRRNIHHRITTVATAATTTTTTCRCRFSDVRLRFTTPRAIVLSDISIIHRHPLRRSVSAYYYPQIAFFLRIAHTNEYTAGHSARISPSR